MASQITAELIGLDSFQRLLGEIPKRLVRQALQPGCRAGAEVLADEVRARAPVDSGELLAGIEVRDGRGASARVVVKSDHVAFVEFGAPGIALNAHPFIRPAFDAVAGKAAVVAALQIQSDVLKLADSLT